MQITNSHTKKQADPSISHADSTISIQDVIQKTANSINSKTPLNIDSETQLDSVQALPMKLQYFYTMKTLSKEDINQDYLQSTFVKNIKNRTCSTPKLNIFFENDASISYFYYDKNGQFISEIIVTPYNCRAVLSTNTQDNKSVEPIKNPRAAF